MNQLIASSAPAPKMAPPTTSQRSEENMRNVTLPHPTYRQVVDQLSSLLCLPFVFALVVVYEVFVPGEKLLSNDPPYGQVHKNR